MLRNETCQVWLIALLAAACVLLLPEIASAQSMLFDGVAAPGGPKPVAIDPGSGAVCPYNGFTRRIVTCINNAVVWGVANFLLPFSRYMATTVAAACCLAVIGWGLLMLGGKIDSPTRDGFVLMLKLAGVVMFTWNFGGVFPVLLDGVEDLINVASSYLIFSATLKCPSSIVWDRLDCTINLIIGGILPGSALTTGLVGFLIACLFSGAIGFIICLLGLYLIIILLLTVASTVYTFIACYVALGSMVVVSPLFIPCILFQVTKAYFEKWLRLTIGFTLQPVIIFAYLSMMLSAFDVVVFTGKNSLYRIMAGNEVDYPPCFLNLPGPCFDMGTWLMGHGVYGQLSAMSVVSNVDPRQMWLQATQDPRFALANQDTGVAGVVANQVVRQVGLWQQDLLTQVLNAPGSNFLTSVPVLAVDFNAYGSARGVSQEAFVVRLIFALVTACAIAYVFMFMQKYIPLIAGGMSGEPFSMPMLGKMMPGGNMGKDIKDTLADKAKKAFNMR